jgi:hypothetical protein
VTAQLECLLDDVVVGKQEMIGAIDAVCDVAQRIIGRPATRRRYQSAAHFSTNTRPRKLTVKRLEGLPPNR